MESVSSFIHSSDFWIYHGFVLSGLWVLASAFGVFIKKYNTLLHVLTFALVDFTTLFFAGSALYRVYPHINHFAQWSPIKQGHVAGGCLFLVLIIVQHIGGVTAFLTNKPNPQHRQFGKILVVIGRTIAGVGWVLGGNINNAIIVGSITAVLLILSLFTGQSKAPATNQRIRSKSPKGKRQ